MAGVNKFLREGAATFRRPASGIQSQLKQNENRRNQLKTTDGVLLIATIFWGLAVANRS
jgi:hypothetical protein